MHTCTYQAGDLGFDPAGLKPAGATELRGMQNAELNNGRAPPPTICSSSSSSSSTAVRRLSAAYDM